jgi:hypothetical protein
MSLEQNIKEWVQLDNQLRVYSENIKVIKDRKTELLSRIVGDDEKFGANLQSKSIQISDGKLKFQNTKVFSPLSFKYLQGSLEKIIRNEDQVQQIIDYVRNNREFKLVPEIKRSS